MAGRGPAPKPAERRVRKVADPVPVTVLPLVCAAQPSLPVRVDGWHERTVEWWAAWGRAAQAVHFVETDWSFLLDTALMHDAMWSKGRWELAAEVRLRVAKFGATPEDRARLRIQFAEAAAVGVPDEQRGPSSRARYAGRARAVTA